MIHVTDGAPYDVDPDVIRAIADAVDALQDQGVSVLSVDYTTNPTDHHRQPVYLEAATAFEGDPISPEAPEDDFPAVLDIDSDHGDADIYVEAAPAIDANPPDATAIWTLMVTVHPNGDHDAQ